MAQPLRYLILALALAAALVTPVAGQAQTEQRVDEAKAEVDGSQRTLVDAKDDLSDAAAHLAAALDEYEQANDELERIAFGMAALEGRVIDHETHMRSLRREVEELVVSAYIAGAPNPMDVFDIAPGPQRAVAQQVAAARTRRNTTTIDELAEARTELAELRSDLATDRSREAELRAEIRERAALLDDLLAGSEEGVRRAVEAVAAADLEYQEALSAYEAEQRRLAALGGVARWQPLVEKYFPADRVVEALKIMHCESRGNPDARHPASDASGLFQFLAGTWAFSSARAGFPGASRFDPEANVAAAAWLLDYSVRTRHRWGPWGRWTCRRVVPDARF